MSNSILKCKTLLLFILVGPAIWSCQPREQKVETNYATIDQYKEPYRPQFHFSPQANWMNDPNGMVYYEGEYHLFYQYHPDSTVWGPMHWGHAVSSDLINWEHLPIALYPDELGYIFSGSTVVDWNNTSGLGTGEIPPMIAIYTYHLMEREKAGAVDYQTQAIAFSTDKGRTWTKYEGNPVLPNPGIKDFRDPKVSWDEVSGKWIMALAVLDHIRFYSSQNLIDWELESEFGKEVGNHGGVWECPDLFKLPVEGTDEEKWVLLVSINPGAPHGGSGTQYFVGDFNGSEFILDESFTPVLDESIWIDYGTDNYAGVTWSDIPENDGRRIFIGWMSNWQYANIVPTDSWRSAMTIPRVLTLRFDGEKYILASSPVAEISEIRGNSSNIEIGEIGSTKVIKSKYELYELSMDLDISQSQGFELVFSNDHDQQVIFGLDRAGEQVYVDRTKSGIIDFQDSFAKVHKSPYKSGNNISLLFHIDMASIEIYIDNGDLVITEIYFPESGLKNFELVPKTGTIAITSGKISELKSIW